MKTNLKKVKWSWVASETKDGYTLKLSAGPLDIRLNGLILPDISQVKKMCKGNIVFIHKKVTITKTKIKNR